MNDTKCKIKLPGLNIYRIVKTLVLFVLLFFASTRAVFALPGMIEAGRIVETKPQVTIIGATLNVTTGYYDVDHEGVEVIATIEPESPTAEVEYNGVRSNSFTIEVNSLQIGENVISYKVVYDGQDGKEYSFILRKYSVNVNSITLTGATLNTATGNYDVGRGAVEVMVDVATEDAAAEVKYKGVKGNPFTIDVNDLQGGDNMIVYNVVINDVYEKKYTFILKKYNTDVDRVLFTGAVYEEESDRYVADCEAALVTVNVVANDPEAIIEYDGIQVNPFAVDVSALRSGPNEISYKVISGVEEEEYNIMLVKPFNLEDITIVRWNNTITVVNNPANNGGYRFTGFEWLRNNLSAGTGQSLYVSEGLNTTDIYQVNVKIEGDDFFTKCCPGNVIIRGLQFEVYPNPLPQGATLNVSADYDSDLLENAWLDIFDSTKQRVYSQQISSKLTTLELSLPAGVYIVNLTLSNGLIETIKLIVK